MIRQTSSINTRLDEDLLASILFPPLIKFAQSHLSSFFGLPILGDNYLGVVRGNYDRIGQETMIINGPPRSLARLALLYT